MDAIVLYGNLEFYCYNLDPVYVTSEDGPKMVCDKYVLLNSGSYHINTVRDASGFMSFAIKEVIWMQ